METITITLDGVEVSGYSGMTILDLARESGVNIPTLCHDRYLAPTGACRLCIVEDESSGNLLASCVAPIRPGMVINTRSPRVIERRKTIVKLMLASHPDSCLVCDTANLCELRRLATDLEVGLPRFRLKKHYYPIEDISPYIIRDLSKCILCRRCVKACNEIAKQNVFSIAYRGFNSKVVVDFDQPIDKEVCRDCDICISFCPTGALSKPSRLDEEKKGKPLVITG